MLTNGSCYYPFLLVIFLLAIGLVGLQAEIPPRPDKGEFFHDYSGVLRNSPAVAQILEAQENCYRVYEVPIVIVTVDRISDYGGASQSIESLAARWFDTWGIGSQKRNTGILVILSVDDRKVRIELGADWGTRFDGYCKRLVDRKMVPEFKEGDYGAGVLAAVQGLAGIASNGLDAEPPTPGMMERLMENSVVDFATQSNPIGKEGGPGVLVLMIVLGVACLIAAIYVPSHRGLLVKIGLGLIAVAIFFWVLVVVAAIWSKFSGGGDSSWGGGDSSWGGGGAFGGGGGFGGGFSGGGGASGSW